MEVHAHTHTSRKKWTHYFWEFLMLFLAVFCGFLAEYQLEHKIEKDRERQFVESMIKELEADLDQVSNVLTDSIRVDSLNVMLNILYSNKIVNNDMRKIYYHSRKYVSSGNYMIFTNNTLTQLKNGGNMRLIRKRNVVDSLNSLDNIITLITAQEEGETKRAFSSIELRRKLINSGYFRKDGKYMGPEYILGSPVNPEWIINNREIILEYANSLADQTGALARYFTMLKEYKAFTTRLISFLKEQYNFK